MSTEYPILCPACKKGYMKLEKAMIYQQFKQTSCEIWVCEYCRFILSKDFDNPSKRKNEFIDRKFLETD